MPKSLKILVFATCLSLSAQTPITVDQVVSFVKSAVKLHQSDKDVAEQLRHMKLRNRLDDRTIEDLQGQGAGPKTIAALNELRNSSANLPPPASATAKAIEPPAPPPSLPEQGKIIEAAREYALNYSKQLPNFLCMEMAWQKIDRNLNDTSGEEVWEGVGSFITRLSFFEQKEDYKVVMVNNKSVSNTSMGQLGGAVSMGEFGSMLKDIFDPSSEAHFEWDHWGKVRGRETYVFSYMIDLAHSKYSMDWERTNHITTACRGLVYIDKELNTIPRFTQEPYDIPSSYPVRAVRHTVDYDFQKIGETEYLVPLKVTVTSRLPKYLARNDVEFRLYQKFGTSSEIKFNSMPDETPDEKTPKKP